MADWLDSRFRLPGTDIRFGLDSVVGLIPGVGDDLLALPSIYILMSAQNLGASRLVLMRMAGNIGVDMVLGTIPVLGDLFDLGFKSNRRNIALLRRHLDKR